MSKKPSTPSSVHFTAALVDAVANTWDAIRANHPDVPAVVFTLGQGAESKGLILGHFHAGAWVQGDESVAELFLGGEGLARGAESVLVTLLHEAAHGVAHTRAVKDTSRQGRYHNAKFKAIGEELGLSITTAGSLGWSASALADGTAARYASTLGQLAAALTAYRRTFGRAASTGRPSSNNGSALTCGCGRKLRASKSVIAAGPIICGLCEEEFTAPDAGE